MAISIAVDGPAASGKSSLAKALAQKMGYLYVSTGELYRAVGYYMVQKHPEGYTPSDVEMALPKIKLELEFVEGNQRVMLDGLDVTDKLDEDEVSMAASEVSKLKSVRDFLLDLQRNVAINKNVVMDGRDIGTVILPDAAVKLFLTASAEVRAKRRANQLKEAGKKADYEAILKNIIDRDINDTTRELAPLKKAQDAIELDNTEYDFEHNLEVMYDIVVREIEK